MLIAIIEYELNPGVQAEFEAEIGRLMPRLHAIDGFLQADAAASLGTPGRFYEISYWTDAASLERWAKDPAHLRAKVRGREALLRWYRIRIAEISRDWQVGVLPADLALPSSPSADAR